VRNEGAYKQLLAPLATSRSGLMMLLAGDLGDLKPGQQEYLEQILQLNEHLIDLVSSWADVERLSSGQVALKPEACNIGVIIQRVASQGIQVSRTGSWPMVLGDPGRLQQLIHNVFEAVGEGRVRARIDGDICIVTIQSAHEVPHHERRSWIQALSGAPTTQHLNLRVARLLAEAHGGSLQLDPHARGNAKFHIRLPRAQQMSLLGDNLK